MTADLRPTLDRPDDDPRLWLEEIDGARAVAWVEAQNQATHAAYGDAAFEADRDAIAAIFDRPDRIPYVSRRGPHLYNYWKDADRPRGLWRRTTMESFRTASPEWDVLFDLDAVAAQENEDWTWSGPTLARDGGRAMLALARGGGDAVVLREFCLETKSFVPDGFELPEAKGGVDWVDRDTLILASAYGAGDPERWTTTSGYARTVRCWRRGEPVDAAPVVYEAPREHMMAYASVDHDRPEETVWFFDKPGFFEQISHMGDRAGPRRRIHAPNDARIRAKGDWLALTRRSDWSIGERTYAAGSVLAGPLSAALESQEAFEAVATPLFEPGPRRVLENYFVAGGRFVLSILDALKPTFEIWTPAPKGWRRARLEGVPNDGTAGLWPLARESFDCDGTLLGNFQSPTTPSTLIMISPDAIEERDGAAVASPEVLKRAPEAFRADELVVSRHEAISTDGTSIPYTMTGPEHASGDAPVLLTGYGGFEIPALPQYDSAIGKTWLEHGGVSVIAHIRGGGEFGPSWHEAGRRAGKRLSHDDFAAVARDLAQRGVTVPGRIAAEGGSNGGLLIANMLTRYPERFGALFCTVPLIDMRRYSKLLAGASWIAEYGDPDAPEDWAFMRAFSAYHTVESERTYPPILIATTRRDDRVHPGHARKMAEKLQGLGYEASYYELAAGGHSYGKDNKERAAFKALGLQFLKKNIGWG